MLMMESVKHNSLVLPRFKIARRYFFVDYSGMQFLNHTFVPFAH
jgi:hypothetical protein